jgi:hypothetical protein
VTEVLRTTGIWLGLGALLYLVLCAALYLFQRSLLYFPQPARGTASSMELSVPSARLQVSLQERSGSRAVLYFGGNAEDVKRLSSTVRLGLAGPLSLEAGFSYYDLSYESPLAAYAEYRQVGASVPN